MSIKGVCIPSLLKYVPGSDWKKLKWCQKELSSTLRMFNWPNNSVKNLNYSSINLNFIDLFQTQDKWFFVYK